MKKITNPERAPEGVWWKVVCPLNGGWAGRELRAKSVPGLRKEMERVARDEGLGLPEPFEAWLTEALCARYPEVCGEPTAGERERMEAARGRVSWGQAARFVKTMISWRMQHGCEMVSDEELLRRAEICRGCPKNLPALGGCAACSGIRAAVRQVVGGDFENVVPFAEELHACSACGCELQAKLRLPVEASAWADRDNPPDYAAGCWMRETVSGGV